jgi:hypothetical protein
MKCKPKLCSVTFKVKERVWDEIKGCERTNYIDELLIKVHNDGCKCDKVDQNIIFIFILYYAYENNKKSQNGRKYD